MFDQVGAPAIKGPRINVAKMAGIIAIVTGFAICLCFALFYDPTATTSGGEQIANIIALNTQQNGILGGLLLAIFGALLLLYSKKP